MQLHPLLFLHFDLNTVSGKVSHLGIPMIRLLFCVTLLALADYASAADPATSRPPSADVLFSNHVANVRRTAPAGFSIVVTRPFVVLGDEPAEIVQERADKTVKWAVDKLKQDYFTRDPDEIINVWLFKDDASYRTNALKLFGDTPATPFGYYTERNKALVMNIATGGGTLVHEIVHPFMRANFPQCPAWFNEGFASLYEQSTERNGRIHGLINWRYKGLEADIKAGKLISFEKLTSLSDDEFYSGADNPNYNDHYAQARYLCFYLQEKGLLVKYYREYRDNVKTDPTGYKTLQRVLNVKDMSKFQKDWEKFILALRTG